MCPAIFIHLKNDIAFLKYCVDTFKDSCTIIVNCYGKKDDVIEYCKENSDHFYQLDQGGKNDIIKSLPFLFEDGVWVCNDDVEVEGDVWGMFEYANSDKENIDLVYPPTDNLFVDDTKIGIHNRHRLSSSAYFLTEHGIKKLRMGYPLAYTYTYYGVNIKHVQRIKSIPPFVSETSAPRKIKEFSPQRIVVEKQLNDLVNETVHETVTRNVVITLTTEGREFITKTKSSIRNIAKIWGADFKIYSDVSEVLTEEQIQSFSLIESKRPHILNYFAKMMCIYDALTKYDRVLWIDDTCIISPFAQNLFSVVPVEELGGFVVKKSYGMNECNEDSRFIKERRDVETSDLYINTGVVLASKSHQSLFSFDEMLKDVDLFESFYPTQAYLIYKITTENIPVYDLKTINHFMPCMLKYEDKLFMQTQTVMPEIKTMAAHAIIHFSGFHKYRETLHEETYKQFSRIFDQNITLVLMNYSRPDNIKNKILPFYTKIPAVNQIIVSHCKESAKFDYDSTPFCEITHRDDIKTDKEFGLFTRYIAAAESAKNRCVVIVDDDLIIPAHVLAQLFVIWKQNPTKIVGTRGRMSEKVKGKWVYNSDLYATSYADIILTHCAMTSKDVFEKLLSQEHIFHETAMSASVPWNGEDIMLSLFAKFLNQEQNIALHCKYINLPDTNAISSTLDHIKSRNRIINEICHHYMKKIYNAII